MFVTNLDFSSPIFPFCTGNPDHPEPELGAVWGGTVEIPPRVPPRELPEWRRGVCEAGGLHAVLCRYESADVAVSCATLMEKRGSRSMSQVLVCAWGRVWPAWSSSSSWPPCWEGSSLSGPKTQDGPITSRSMGSRCLPNLTAWQWSSGSDLEGLESL